MSTKNSQWRSQSKSLEQIRCFLLSSTYSASSQSMQLLSCHHSLTLVACLTRVHLGAQWSWKTTHSYPSNLASCDCLKRSGCLQTMELVPYSRAKSTILRSSTVQHKIKHLKSPSFSWELLQAKSVSESSKSHTSQIQLNAQLAQTNTKLNSLVCHSKSSQRS